MTDLPKRYTFDEFAKIILSKIGNGDNISFPIYASTATTGILKTNYYQDDNSHLIMRTLRHPITEAEESTLVLRDIDAFYVYLLADLDVGVARGSVTIRSKDSGDGSYHGRYGKEYVTFMCNIADIILPRKEVKDQILERFKQKRPKPVPAGYSGMRSYASTHPAQREIIH
mgnify:CR=1 FL=1